MLSFECLVWSYRLDFALSVTQHSTFNTQHYDHGGCAAKRLDQGSTSPTYVKRAKAEGMRSRAAYKIGEIAARDRLLAPGMLVVDLGAAPGGWSAGCRRNGSGRAAG